MFASFPTLTIPHKQNSMSMRDQGVRISDGNGMKKDMRKSQVIEMCHEAEQPRLNGGGEGEVNDDDNGRWGFSSAVVVKAFGKKATIAGSVLMVAWSDLATDRVYCWQRLTRTTAWTRPPY